MKLYFVRHGETIQNKEGIIQGWHGGELSPKGVQQALEVGKKLAGYHPTLLVSSDLHRTIQTSNEIRKSFTNDLHVLYDWRLRERSFGEHEGNPQADYNWDDILAHLEQNTPYINIESNPMIERRIISFMHDIDEFYDFHDHIIVVTHGGILNCVSRLIDSRHVFKKFENTAIVEVDSKRLNIK